MKVKMPIVTAPYVVKVPRNFLIFRSLQLSFAVLVLALSIYGAVYLSNPLVGVFLSIFTSLCTIIVSSYTLVATYGDVPRIYNYWIILTLEIVLLVLWLVSFVLLALPVGEAFYFVTGGRGGRYSRYEVGYEADQAIVVFVNLMMVAVAAGSIEFILYFITLVTFSTIVHYHRRNSDICACVDSECGTIMMGNDPKTNNEKAQVGPESLIYPAEDTSPDDTNSESPNPEDDTPEQTNFEQNAYEQEQHHTNQQDDLTA